MKFYVPHSTQSMHLPVVIGMFTPWCTHTVGFSSWFHFSVSGHLNHPRILVGFYVAMRHMLHVHRRFLSAYILGHTSR